MGNLATLPPPVPAMLWTSMATGVMADRHGVLDASEPEPRTAGLRTVGRASLRLPYVWEMLAADGIRCRTVGWPVTHPARGPAICVSDGFAGGRKGSLWPGEMESTLRELRFDPQEWTAAELKMFVPRFAEVNQDTDRGLAKLGVLLAEATSVQAAATRLMEYDPAELTVVHVGAIGAACEAFGGRADMLYGDVVEGVYRYLDMMLGRLVELGGPDTLVMLVSERAALERAAPAPPGGELQGIFAAAGPGIEADELVFGASILDVAPTLLGLFSYERTEGMTGRRIPELAGSPAERGMEFVREPEAVAAVDELVVDEEIAALASWGYTDVVAGAHRAEAEAGCRRRKFNLAWVLLAQRRELEAIPLLEALSREEGSDPAMRLYLAHAYLRTGRMEECGALCNELSREFPKHPLTPVAMAFVALAASDADAARRELAHARLNAGLMPELDTTLGELYLRVGRAAESAEAFQSALRLQASLVQAQHGLARALMELGRYEEAAEAAMAAIRMHFEQPAAHATLSRALKAMGRHEDAERAQAAAERLSRGARAA